MDTEPTPGDRLKAWRKALSLSQTEAGSLVEVSAPTWCDWEAGKKNPSGVHREALAVLTGIPGDAWNGGKGRSLLARVLARRATLEATAPPAPPPATPTRTQHERAKRPPRIVRTPEFDQRAPGGSDVP